MWSFERRGLVAFIQAHNMGINKVVEMTKTGELVTAGNDRAIKIFRTDLFNESVEQRLSERALLDSGGIVSEMLEVDPYKLVLLTGSF